MISETYLFYLLIPIVAFLYSTVGHGGASGYLGLMAIFSFPSVMMKQTALLLNLFVAGIAFYQYFKAGYFNKRLFLCFALGSVPAAFVGGLWSLDSWLYNKFLGLLLFFAITRMLFKRETSDLQTKKIPTLLALLIGVIIGLFSGLIGIGGGIILTPIILLFHWGNMKEAAAVSALFIWVNSASGLLGQLDGVHSLQFRLCTHTSVKTCYRFYPKAFHSLLNFWRIQMRPYIHFVLKSRK